MLDKIKQIHKMVLRVENLESKRKKILIAFYSKIKQTVIQASHSFPIPSMKPHSNLLIR